jgi:hypothetical protein
MIKEFTLALGLAVAAPIAMTTAAFAADNTRHDGAAMHGDRQKDKMAGDRHERRRHAMHARNRDSSMDRDEARVTTQLNQRQLGDNRTR